VRVFDISEYPRSIAQQRRCLRHTSHMELLIDPDPSIPPSPPYNERLGNLPWSNTPCLIEDSVDVLFPPAPTFLPLPQVDPADPLWKLLPFGPLSEPRCFSHEHRLPASYPSPLSSARLLSPLFPSDSRSEKPVLCVLFFTLLLFFF